MSLNYPTRKLHRRTDPTTSALSAADTRGRITNRGRVLAAFARRPASGLDYVTAAALADLERHEAERRISDLRNLGYLAVKVDRHGHEVKVILSTGRPARVHVITPAGLAAVRSKAGV